jgi:hypothetical protein
MRELINKKPKGQLSTVAFKTPRVAKKPPHNSALKKSIRSLFLEV